MKTWELLIVKDQSTTHHCKCACADLLHRRRYLKQRGINFDQFKWHALDATLFVAPANKALGGIFKFDVKTRSNGEALICCCHDFKCWSAVLSGVNRGRAFSARTIHCAECDSVRTRCGRVDRSALRGGVSAVA